MPRIQLHNMGTENGSVSKKKRVGRGWASRGKYCGRGAKGQKARSGSHGHQLRGLRATMLATPKVRGFNSRTPKPFVISLSALSELFIDGETVTPKTLVKKGVIQNISQCVKILASGSVAKKLTVKHCVVSKQACEKIRAAGGTID